MMHAADLILLPASLHRKDEGGGGVASMRAGIRLACPRQTLLRIGDHCARFSPRRFSATPREWASVRRRAVLVIASVCSSSQKGGAGFRGAYFVAITCCQRNEFR